MGARTVIFMECLCKQSKQQIWVHPISCLIPALCLIIVIRPPSRNTEATKAKIGETARQKESIYRQL